MLGQTAGISEGDTVRALSDQVQASQAECNLLKEKAQDKGALVKLLQADMQ